MIVGNEEYKKWDSADFIETKEDVCYYLEAMIEEGYVDVFQCAIDSVFRSKGLKKAAAGLGTTVEALAEKIGKDTAQPLEAICRLLDTLGYRINVVPKSHDKNGKRKIRLKKHFVSVKKQRRMRIKG